MMADNEIKIRLGADEKPAMGAVSRLRGAFQSLAGAARGVMRALGTFHWAVQAFQTIAGWARELHAWLGRDAEEARRLREEMERASIQKLAQDAAESFKHLNERLAETNRLERERNEILDRRRARSRDWDDAEMELAREREIAKLDPESGTYARDKAAVVRKYAARTADVAAERATADADAERARLFGEARGRERSAALLEQVHDRQTEAAVRQGRVAWRAEMAERTAKDGEAKTTAKAAADKARQEAAALNAAADKTLETIRALRAEAAFLYKRAEAGGSAAGIRRDAAKVRLENEAREEAAAAKKAADAKAAAEAEARRRWEEAERREAEREAAAKARGIEAAGRALAAGVAGADAVSANRLTAMGLGSGVSAHGGGVAADVRKLVDVAKKILDVTKDIEAGEDAPAVFGTSSEGE